MLRPPIHPAARHVAGLSVALAGAAAAVAALLTGGCGSDTSTAPKRLSPGSTTFVGIFTNSVETGRLKVTIATASLAAPIRVERTGALSASHSTVTLGATGTYIFNGIEHMLAGSYFQNIDSLSIAGAGYTFSGRVNHSGPTPTIKGAYSGPHGAGGFGCAMGDYATVHFYCGTCPNDSVTVHGVFDFTVAAAKVVGIAFPGGDTGTPFEGFVTGSGDSLDLTFDADVPGDHHMIGSGTLATVRHLAHGTWSDYDYNSQVTETGTFSASSCP